MPTEADTTGHGPAAIGVERKVNAPAAWGTGAAGERHGDSARKVSADTPNLERGARGFLGQERRVAVREDRQARTEAKERSSKGRTARAKVQRQKCKAYWRTACS